MDKKLLKRAQAFPMAVCFLRGFSNTTVFLPLPSSVKWIVCIPSTAWWVFALAYTLWEGQHIESGQSLHINHPGERKGWIDSGTWLFCTQLVDLSNSFSKVCGARERECVSVCVCVMLWIVVNEPQHFHFQDKMHISENCILWVVVLLPTLPSSLQCCLVLASREKLCYSSVLGFGGKGKVQL